MAAHPFRGALPILALLLLLLLPASLAAQSDPAFRDLRWRNIGPANMVGRVTDIEAVASNPAIVYVASASGGLFRSTNAGTTFEQVFANYGTSNMGDVEIFPGNPDIVWVGTGESCTRNSIGWGDGVYRSTDGGRTFTNVGLRETHHISEVVAHPTDADVAWVAAQGHLWGYNGERGVYKTTDGGKTWRKLTRGLPDDGRTGASDLVIDPSNPDVLYAGMWERIRRPHTFESGGPNGGIYKSTDGGETWTKLTTGLPAGDIGKVGLAIFRKDPRILVALVEHGYQPAPRTPEYADLSKLGSGLYRSEDGGATWQFLNRGNNRPFYYSHVYIDPNDAERVYVLATQGQVSTDGGRTFSASLQGIDLDFHALWIDPNNSDRFYVGNDKGAHVTYDRGRTFIMFDNIDASQFYAVTADNREPYWVYGGLQDNGNWGGPSNSRDYNGVLNDHWFKFHSGDGFHATVDPDDWRTVYTESQGGNIRRLDAVFRQQGKSITPTPATVTNYEAYAGAPAPAPAAGGPQGFGGARLPREQFRFNWSTPIVLSPHDSRTIYYAGNHVFRSTDRGDSWTIISPDLSTNDPVLTNPQSGGLTPDITGAETHGTAITVMESPVTRGVLWVGTDDGNVQLTRDGGKTWHNVRPNIRGVPERLWVSRVEPSHFDAGTAFVSFDGHRSDDFRPYVFVTTDWGRTWTNLAANIPQHEPVYVVKEDPKNPNLLFVGTEFSVYASLDRGKSWRKLMNDMPTVPVHDLVIHPREGDLIAATHGRGIWILDDITPLQQLAGGAPADVHLFENRVATKWRGVSRGATRGHFYFAGRNPLTIAQRPPSNSPSELQNSATVSFWLKEAPAQPVQVEITSADGSQKYTGTIAAAAGLNRWFWNLRFAPAAPPAGRPPMGAEAEAALQQARARMGGAEAPAGTYDVKLVVAGRTYQTKLVVREDPEFAARR